MTAPELCYVEDCLPGATRAERVALARRLGLGLEVADREDDALEEVLAAGIAVPTLQAYGMHERHPLQRDPELRAAARPYVLGVLERAARAGVPRVLTACGFGPCLTDGALERCLDFYAGIEPRARALGLLVLIEPLSPLRADAMAGPTEIAALLERLAAPELFAAALDTGHLADGGHDVELTLRHFPARIEELQLRGPAGAPPAPDLPLARWLAALPTPPRVLAIEHRQPIALPQLERLLQAARPHARRA